MQDFATALPPSTLGRVWPRALAETAAYLVACALVDKLAFGGRQFAGFEPHPYLLIVVLVAAQYGRGAGMLSAALSATAFLLARSSGARIGEDMNEWQLRVLVSPVMWLAAGTIVGALRDRQLAALWHGKRELDERREQVHRLEAQVEEREAMVRALEGGIAAQTWTFPALAEAAAGLARLDPVEVFAAVPVLLDRALCAERFSVWRLCGGCLEAAHLHGHAGGPRPRALGADEPQFRAIVGERRTLCVMRPADCALLAEDALLASPILSRSTGAVYGMIQVERIGFLEIAPASYAVRAAGEWIGEALANAERYEELLERSADATSGSGDAADCVRVPA